MERPNNPFRKGGVAFNVMEASLQGEFDGLPGLADLTSVEIAELFDVTREAIANAFVTIQRKTGYVVPHVKMAGGRKKQA